MKTIKSLVAEFGAGQLLVLFPMRPLRSLGFLRWTSSADNQVIVPTCIVEERYRVAEGYKITLQSLIDGFGKETLYQSDLESLIREGTVQLYIKQTLE